MAEENQGSSGGKSSRMKGRSVAALRVYADQLAAQADKLDLAVQSLEKLGVDHIYFDGSGSFDRGFPWVAKFISKAQEQAVQAEISNSRNPDNR